MRENYTFVGDFVFLFPAEWNFGPAKFDDETIFLDDFVMSFSKFTVNFHAETDELKRFLSI